MNEEMLKLENQIYNLSQVVDGMNLRLKDFEKRIYQLEKIAGAKAPYPGERAGPESTETKFISYEGMK